jgi:predicted Rossmann fold flavoprotein
MRIGILGGGAAGFFAAIHCKLFNDNAEVIIIEKSHKLLSKVKISGGGRCNVTNVESDPSKLSRNYPRGERQLSKAFREFNTEDTINFFEKRGVPLVAQEDGCIFPKSQNSQSIIDCFMNECDRLKIKIQTGIHIDKVYQEDNNSWSISSKTDRFHFDKLIICVGGLPKLEQMQWLQNLGQAMVPPYPSLFTFNMPDESIRELMGIVAPQAVTRIPGSKHQGSGPLLITHWGMSGPAVLMLSAKAARELGACDYQFTCSISWLGIAQENPVRSLLVESQNAHPKKKIGGSSFQGLSTRLWRFLLNKTLINPDKTWDELSQKELNRLIVTLTQDAYKVKGKTTFKEEFVTAGGVDLNGINFKSMESKTLPNLFFAGEVLDIDGITGGFNFQAAWTTAWLAARGASGVLNSSLNTAKKS